MTIRNYKVPKYVYVMWLSVVLAIGLGIFRTDWTMVFVSVLTLGLTIYSVHIYNKLELRIPSSLLSALILFVYATLFLGEVGDFYERFWWWDIVLHAGSAIGFGLIGLIVLILIFKHNNVEASPKVVVVFAFTFAVAIGAVWEIFEFAMDILFGLSMQKSGLVDTMSDLIINSIGALLASSAGYLYLKQKSKSVLTSVIKDVVENN